MAKTENLLIRLTAEDKARLQRVAEAHYLEMSTWARQVLLRALEEAERVATKRRSRR
ncbi:MAG: hypothetical protein OEY20_14140 [Gemmatimonadota bacterium]|nr:hypothetical protein [Gemmatimonadota bacterium]MDH5198379.1 hypothetical protein [Gemmatimonadota bacterium]